LQKGLRPAVAVTLALAIVGLALLQPVSGQPGQWKAINPVFVNLNDVWMVSSTQGWAVGDSGTAIYWDGTQWHQILTPGGYKLESVACLSANNCIAVGTTGVAAVLLQWDGISWVDRSNLLLGLGITKLHAIYLRSDGFGFAVGEGATNIVRVNVSVSPPTVASEGIGFGAPDCLRSVWILPLGTPGSIQGFAVGDNCGGTGVTWRWDGTPGGWLSASPGAVGILYGTHVLSPTDAVAVGASDGRTRWNGATWTAEGGAVVTTTWRAVYALASNDEWMVGDAAGGFASIAHWNGVAWSAFAPPSVPVIVDLNSIYMLSSSDGWAVGDGGIIMRWNGSSWDSVVSPVASPNYLSGVWLASSADGWAVGGWPAPPPVGQIFRWNGANWNLYQTSPVTAQLNAIHGSASTDVFAVGNCPGVAPACGAGVPPVVVHWTGGPAWVNISPAGVASNVNLLGVFAVSPSLAFAVGDPPGAGSPATMLKWDGTLWASIPSGTDNNVYLRSVWMVSSTDGWAVGTVGTAGTGTIVRWNGAAWAAETSPATTLALNAVQALTSNDVWAVGDSGKIIHRDGIGWSVVPSGVTQDLNSLYMLSPTEGWAVGDTDATSSIILYWNGSTWTRVFPVPTVPYNLNSVWMVASTDGWTVGQNGLIERFGPGPVTTVTTVPVTATSTTTQYVTSTSVTSTVFTQVTSTSTQIIPTTTTSTTLEVTTGTIGLPPAAPVPGFPLESILAGLVAGAAALFILRRRGRT
jgi:photosystem II stability/assembly factor-like uncharacterized protein